MFSFKKFDNGQYNDRDNESNGVYKTISIITRHPRIIEGIITAKKSWGLHVKLWSEGISECDFTKEEILDDFKNSGISIPVPFLKDLDNQIFKVKMKKYNKLLK